LTISDPSSPQPVHNERGLLMKDEENNDILIISDIHIGFEEELIADGIYVPNQTKDIVDRVKRITDEHSVKRIVINGDLKHRVPTTPWKERKKKLDLLEEEGDSRSTEIQQQIDELLDRMKKAEPSKRKELQERFEQLEKKKSEFYRKKRKKEYGILERSEIEMKNVALFLRGLLEIAEVDVVPGNHDGRIARELDSSFPSLASDPGIRFHSSSGIIIGNTGIFHGHAWPSPEVMAGKYLVMGHGHAAILLTDSLGVRNYEQCWLRAPLSDKVHEKYLDADGEVILMPSFNDFFRGSPVNRKGRLLGPLFKNDYVDVENGQVFLLDGVNLGKVSALRQFAQGRGRR